MEVHHPHHPTHKKEWQEYLLEFFMLFFAVTLGFLAENTREHYIEKEREYELAKSLYYEMKADSVDLEKVTQFRIKKEEYLNFLYENFRGDSEVDSTQKKFQVAEYIGVVANYAMVFEPRNAILHQLESSGMMRYFKDETIQSDLHNIINTAEKVRHRMQREIELYEKFVLPLSVKYRNMDFQRILLNNERNMTGLSISDLMEKYLQSSRIYKTPKRIIPTSELNEMHRSFEYYRFIIMSTRNADLSAYRKINAMLLIDLKNQYKL